MIAHTLDVCNRIQVFMFNHKSVFSYLFVEVEETFGAVDVMERGERLDGSVDGHGVKPHGSPRGDQHPVRRRSADEHLRR